MIEHWDDLSDYRRQEAIAPAAAALGISPENAARLVTAALAKARHTALESASDADIPEQMRVLALITEAVTGQPVTAIKRGMATRDITAYPPGCDRLGYHARRLSGQLPSTDPPPQRQEYIAYYFVTPGNPITIEHYLKSCGYPEAFADRPTACRVCDIHHPRSA
jgi:hypothetical protein